MSFCVITFSLRFCPLCRVYIAIDLKTVLVAIAPHAPHAQGIFVKIIGQRDRRVENLFSDVTLKYMLVSKVQ